MLMMQAYPVALGRIEKWKARQARSAGNFLSRPSTFLALQVQLVVLVSAFVMVSTVWSISCFLFFYSRCPRAQSFVKVGARAPVPYGVGVTFAEQFHTKRDSKTAILSQCTVSQGLFS